MSENKIKRVSTFINTDEESFLTSVIEYDINGNVTTATIWSSKDILESKVEYKYHDNGHLAEQKNYFSEDEISEHFIFVRDEEGKIISEEIHYPSGDISFRKYIRNEDSKELRIESADEDGEFEGLEILKFNDEGKPTEKIAIDDMETVESHIKYEYNDKNEVVIETRIDSKGQIESKLGYAYNDKGSVTKIVRVNRKNELIDSVEYSYDENGNQIEQKYADNHMIRRSYNNDNQLILEEQINTLGIVESSIETIYNEDGSIAKESGLNFESVYEYIYY